MKLITINKLIQTLKTVINMAIKNGWMSANPFPGHRFKHDRLDVVYLTVDELDVLEHFEIKSFNHKLRLTKERKSIS